MYSEIENRVLRKFDRRDLKYGRFIIPRGVTDIGAVAFNNCSEMTSIIIPNSVTSIGDFAFSGCSGLTSITIPNSVTKIGDSAFQYCKNLTSVTIPNSVKSIGSGTFGNCLKLTLVTIPNGVKSIGDFAFNECSSLISIIIPNSVTEIGSHAFRECESLASVTIPNSVTDIGDYAFVGCTNLASVTILNGVTSISDHSFCNCENLTSITIPDSVKSIENSAFCNCKNLTSITIPNGLTQIGSSAFYNCGSLRSITIPDSVTRIGIGAFECWAGLTSVKIGNSVTEIEKEAFASCKSLTSIIIPDSVTSIGERVLGYCRNLTSITIPKRLLKDLEGVPPLTLIKTEDGKENCFGLIKAGIAGKGNTSKIKKIMNNPTFKGQNTDDFFNLLINLGLFEDKKSKMTMLNDQGKKIMQPTSNVGFNILQKLFKENGGLLVKDMHMHFQSMRPVGVNEEFLRFLSNKTNLVDIIEQEKKQNGFITRVQDWFGARKSLNNLQEIEDTANMTTTPTSEENRYKVRTYSTAESGIDKIKWKTPTVKLLLKEFRENKFLGVTNETRPLADFFGDYDLYEQRHFEKAVELDKERQEKGTPDHILNEKLKQSYTESFKEYLEKTNTLRKEILNEAGKTLKSQADIADEVFTYEMLARSDKANFVMGFFTSCCATLYGAGAGAMRAMIVDRRMQPIVIKDRKDEIVAFGILYVNKEKGYAVVNDVEVNIRYQYSNKARKAIYDKFMQGIEAFVAKYNEEFIKPIRRVHCGLSPNWVAVNDFIRENPKGKTLEAPDFNDFKYAGSGSWAGDWHKEQYVLWQENGKEKGV